MVVREELIGLTQDPAVAYGERGGSFVVATVVTVGGVHDFPPFLQLVLWHHDNSIISISYTTSKVKGHIVDFVRRTVVYFV